MAQIGENLSTGDCLRGAFFITSLKWSGLGFDPGPLLESDGAEDRVLRGHRDRPVGMFSNKFYVIGLHTERNRHRIQYVPDVT
jgi:hypothetical protein